MYALAHTRCSLRLPCSQPAAYCARKFNVYKGDLDGEHGIKFAKGTTTLAFKFKGGVLVSVDSRSTQGAYIGQSHRACPRGQPSTLPSPCRSFWYREEDH